MVSNQNIFGRTWLLPVVVITIALMALTFWAATSFKAEAQNASIQGAVTDQLTLIEQDSSGATDLNGSSKGDWQTILEGDIRTSNWADVVVDVSIECGLLTDTMVKSKGGDKDRSMAEAKVEIQVLVTGEMGTREFHPGTVVFCSRSQELIAHFGGVLDCVDENGDNVINYTECELTDEQLQLILETLGAHAFNFIYTDLDSGEYHIDVQARLSTNAEWMRGSAFAKAFVGKGSMVVDEVKLAKYSDLNLTP